MQHLEWLARDRIARFEEQLAKISRSEFTPDSTANALQAIGVEIRRLKDVLDEVAKYKNSVFLIQHVTSINFKLYSLTNYLGVLLRSTNLRNSFEAYYAFEEISRKLIGDSDKLIICSEWDSSPFYIPNPPAVLDGYVFIGMPAFASRNALLLPLAAHELGHAVWRIRSIDAPLLIKAADRLRVEIEKDETSFRKDFGLEENLFFSTEKERIVSECLKLVASQAQEVFCDIFGVSLFGRSYLYAFDFFLAPGFGTREYDYPSLVDRVEFMKRIVDLGNSDLLEEPVVIADKADVLNIEVIAKSTPPIRVPPIVALADTIVKDLIPSLIDTASRIAQSVEYPTVDVDAIEDMIKNLEIGIPPRCPRSPVDILNAIWAVFRSSITKTPTGAEQRAKITLLMNNLCLKSLEIYEYNKVKGRL